MMNIMPRGRDRGHRRDPGLQEARRRTRTAYKISGPRIAIPAQVRGKAGWFPSVSLGEVRDPEGSGPTSGIPGGAGRKEGHDPNRIMPRHKQRAPTRCSRLALAEGQGSGSGKKARQAKRTLLFVLL